MRMFFMVVVTNTMDQEGVGHNVCFCIEATNLQKIQAFHDKKDIKYWCALYSETSVGVVQNRHCDDCDAAK